MIEIQRYWKAIAALAGPAVTALVIAWFVTTPGVITGDEWAIIIPAALGGGALTASVPANKTRAEIQAARARRR